MRNPTLLLGTVLFWSASALAEEIPTFTAVMENGPSANRINVVFLSEAYVASQRETYFNDVAIATEGLFNFTPFKEYKNYFNVYAIWAASRDSFLSVVARGEEPGTYFGQWGGLGSDGEKVERVVREFLGVDDPVIYVMLVNDDGVTAAGSRGGMTIGTGRLHHDPVITEVVYVQSVRHEFAHALGDLMDEYDGLLVLRPGETESNFPVYGRPLINITTETRRDFIKWKHWIDDPAIPIPTPALDVYADQVGLFEGAFSFDKGWYRPKLNCAMRGEREFYEELPPFCEVCREALVLEIYRQVDPTAAFDAAIGETATVFSISPPTPADHSLSIQWLVDGREVASENPTSLRVSDAGVGYGRHTVTVVVEDTTKWVRKDTVGLLKRSLEWRPIVFYPRPDFSGDGVVDFDDFLLFADVFGLSAQGGREAFDLDWSGGLIDFDDFLLFADAFGR